jgi:undecaprenyl diphosphate synthase
MAKTESSRVRPPAQLDLHRLPQHIAIIMDGNGRWAKQRHLPRIEGHRAGIRAVRQVVEGCAQLRVPYLTLYAFSAENWKRPPSEVSLLMRLLREYLKRELRELNTNNIRLGVIGRIHELSAPVRHDLLATMEQTKQNTGLQLTLALNYGGRTELVDALRSIVDEIHHDGEKALRVDEKTVSRHLYTRDLPDPDLLIRTSGEMRLSNFLLWQAAYAEIWVTDTLWPDFRQADLFRAIVDYQKRERRYGGLG